MLTDEQLAQGWKEPIDLIAMLGCPIIYRNTDSLPTVQLEAWINSIVEGWPVVEFGDNSQAIVRPSRIIAYREVPHGLDQ